MKRTKGTSPMNDLISALNTFIHLFPWGERFLLLLHHLKDAKTPEEQGRVRLAIYLLMDELRKENRGHYLLADGLFTAARIAMEKEVDHE